jgi:glycosyltransferase involved in cell wall biosynthesis
MLLKLVVCSKRDHLEHIVIGLGSDGPIGTRLRAAGIKVFVLNLRTGNRPSAISELLRLARMCRPDVIQGWMYHGNLAASAMRMATSGRPPVVWGIRQTLYDYRYEKPWTARVIRIGAVLSRKLPDKIVYNSRLSAAQHAALGYDASRAVVIPNGFDLERYSPSTAARVELRAELGLDESTPIVGMLARFHPMKRHDMFLESVQRIRQQIPSAHFVLAGRGVDSTNPGLAELVSKHGLGRFVSFLGERGDVARILAGIDILCLPSSWGEGFPNIVGEAMACGTACVVTDVGDSATIVGSTGEVVRRGDAKALAEATVRLLSEPASKRRDRGLAGRLRIKEHYSLASVVSDFEQLYQSVLPTKADNGEP